MVKTVRSSGQNRQISQDWAILVLLVSSTLKRDKQKYARSFKKKRDERDLTVRQSNDDRPPMPALQDLTDLPNLLLELIKLDQIYQILTC